MFTVRRALISVSDKRNLVAFAKGLQDLGIEILSTGGTCRQLNEAGITAIEVSSKTGFPEIMGGRVKTKQSAAQMRRWRTLLRTSISAALR